MDVTQVLKEAWVAVEAAELPPEMQQVAFGAAVALLGVPRSAQRQEAPAGPPIDDRKPEQSGVVPTGQSETPVDDLLSEDELFAKFASESSVDEEDLRRVYIVKEGRFRVGLAKRALGDTEAARNRNVAALMLGAAWHVLGQQQISLVDVREAVKAVGYEPSRNLGKHVETMSGVVAVGSRSDKAVRVQTSKFDEPFKALILELTGE
ncbi:hypothetical protein QP157_15865 [Sphingomonas sp. LR61]|uniref:hypothetical protein n=1 Tax=Sphingomonas sp. LR61 TaxID=3050234 RepID=UPI002FE09FB7